MSIEGGPQWPPRPKNEEVTPEVGEPRSPETAEKSAERRAQEQAEAEEMMRSPEFGDFVREHQVELTDKRHDEIIEIYKRHRAAQEEELEKAA